MDPNEYDSFDNNYKEDENLNQVNQSEQLGRNGIERLGDAFKKGLDSLKNFGFKKFKTRVLRRGKQAKKAGRFVIRLIFKAFKLLLTLSAPFLIFILIFILSLGVFYFLAPAINQKFFFESSIGNMMDNSRTIVSAPKNKLVDDYYKYIASEAILENKYLREINGSIEGNYGTARLQPKVAYTVSSYDNSFSIYDIILGYNTLNPLTVKDLQGIDNRPKFFNYVEVFNSDIKTNYNNQGIRSSSTYYDSAPVEQGHKILSDISIMVQNIERKNNALSSVNELKQYAESMSHNYTIRGGEIPFSAEPKQLEQSNIQIRNNGIIEYQKDTETHYDFNVEDKIPDDYQGFFVLDPSYKYSEPKKVRYEDAAEIKDYYNREEAFALDENFLFSLNNTIFRGDINYPQAFTKPVPINKNDMTFNRDAFTADGSIFSPTGYSFQFGYDPSEYGLATVYVYKTDYIYHHDVEVITKQDRLKVYDYEKAYIYEMYNANIEGIIYSLEYEIESLEESISEAPPEADVSSAIELLRELRKRLNLYNSINQYMEKEIKEVKNDFWYIPIVTHDKVIKDYKEKIYLLDKVITFAGEYYFEYEYTYEKMSEDREHEENDDLTDENGLAYKNLKGEYIPSFINTQSDSWVMKPTPIDVIPKNINLSYYNLYLNNFVTEIPVREEEDSEKISGPEAFFEKLEEANIGDNELPYYIREKEHIFKDIADKYGLDRYILMSVLSITNFNNDSDIEKTAIEIKNNYNKYIDYNLPWLAAVQVYLDPASSSYMKNKKNWLEVLENEYHNSERNLKLFFSYYKGNQPFLFDYFLTEEEKKEIKKSKGFFEKTRKIEESISELDQIMILQLSKAYKMRTTVSKVTDTNVGFWDDEFAETVFTGGLYTGYNLLADSNPISINGITLPMDMSRGRLTSPYGYRIHPILKTKKFHAGIDIAVGTGTPLYAMQDGMVVFSGNSSGYGKLITVDYGDFVSLYGHCSNLLVRKGESVTQGQVIALSGNTGRSTGPHLHLEIRIDNMNGLTVDPIKSLGLEMFRGLANLETSL